VAEWVIYYGDGSTFSDEDGLPEVAPPRDIQLIIVTDPEAGWRTIVNHDYYVWDARGGQPMWWGVDKFGLFDYLLDPGMKRVLFGRLIDTPTFNAIFQRALSDPRLAAKTNFVNGEAHP